MSAATLAPGARLRWSLADIAAVTQRNLIAYLRIPQALFFASVQPIMFVLLFRYVFGGAIRVPGFDYVNFMMPGIFVQTVLFGGIGTAIGLSEDLHKGLIERFRALPMARSAVLAGRTIADLVRNAFVIGLITGVGYLVGFRVQTSVLAYLAGAAVMLLFAYAVSWGFAIVGLSAPNSEVAQTMAFPLIFPLIFISSAFVPLQTLPAPLEVFARHQPVSITIEAARALMLGGPTATNVVKSLAWSTGILLVLVPLAVRRYRRVV
ncbi:MAG TPA: ABC transporter permease [Actinomycetota bacterium]|jgi:ABC transporter DrrB family efflux protein|nr:ABC transporter permease [Actinomycetota bacterium]